MFALPSFTYKPGIEVFLFLALVYGSVVIASFCLDFIPGSLNYIIPVGLVCFLVDSWQLGLYPYRIQEFSALSRENWQVKYMDGQVFTAQLLPYCQYGRHFAWLFFKIEGQKKTQRVLLSRLSLSPQQWRLLQVLLHY